MPVKSLTAIIGRRKPRRPNRRIMGNEPSTQVDEFASPLTLEARNIEAVAKYVKQHNVKKIVVMVRVDPHEIVYPS